MIKTEFSIGINPNESEAGMIWNQFLNPNQSELGLIQTKLSIRINPNESEVGMIQTEFSIRINPNQSEVKNRSDLILFNRSQLSKWIRTNPKPIFQSEPIWARIDPNKMINQNQSEWIRCSNDPNRIFNQNQSESIRG